MEKIKLTPLSKFPIPLKVLCTFFIITILMGYMVSIIQIYDRTQFSMEKTKIQYRGADTEDDTALHVPQSFRTLLSITHVHSLSQPLMFALMGLIFIFSYVPDKAKTLLISLIFLGSIISNSTSWLIKYGAGGLVWLFPISQVMIAFSLLFMSIISLHEMWTKEKLGEIRRRKKRSRG